MRQDVHTVALVQTEQPELHVFEHPPAESKYPEAQIVQLPALVLLQLRQCESEQKKHVAP